MVAGQQSKDPTDEKINLKKTAAFRRLFLDVYCNSYNRLIIQSITKYLDHFHSISRLFLGHKIGDGIFEIQSFI